MSERIKGMVLCALAMATVGSTVVASKVIAGGLPPFTATALRFAMALPVFLLLLRVTRTPWPRPDRRDLVLLLGQAGLGSVGYTVLLILGVRWAPAASAGVVAGTLPAVAALVAVLALRERPGSYLVGSIVLATAGVLAISWPGEGSAGDSKSPAAMAGNLLVLGAVVCEAMFILLNKRLRVPVRPLALSTLMTAFGLLLSLVPALFERAWEQPLPNDALIGVAYYALVPTVLGFVLWFAGSARLKGAEAALFTALLPVSALILAALWLGESISPAQIGGAACVLGAVGLASRDGRGGKRPESPLRPAEL
ncbi:drug/metabolite transporter (DMT)-like permease [Variovorax boronicumulans]|uniref:Drug/metabolite transporter (DMT)-like permease n=1 Tax=Variovorax boronicumulans TaxID=436515 RepID=A0AAW8CSC2_9BURK|nr:DMT family transporter [Variovorax boronicumulans]MDP9891827.1 drug/metabolite transporter (DMT)-like permease [Variovorax boronicumulans]MDQ0053000.1 drug/metabolite transporter (DMT)-like permease [Variovorax boronicumulans]